MHQFTNESLYQITNILNKDIHSLKAGENIEFTVLNPDFCDSTYSGTSVFINNTEYIYRSLKAYTELCELLFCKMLVPIPKDDKSILLRFKKLNTNESFHNTLKSSEKYGTNSIFSKIHKNEEPAFLMPYLQALKNVTINKRTRILNLGVNNAEEFELIKKYASNFDNLELVGIDYCQSAITEAKKKFKESNVHFIQHDINQLETLQLGEFDLIISIGTLQSSGIEFKPTFMNWVQNYLKKEGAMILGFPNCRWMDGEMIYGAKAKNYTHSEMSLLIKDAHFCKKYLQQKKFRVTLTGKNYLFLTATSIR